MNSIIAFATLPPFFSIVSAELIIINWKNRLIINTIDLLLRL